MQSEKYKDKTISILGDSISTFRGYIPIADGKNLAHRSRYPQANLLTEVEKTWWMRLITSLSATLGINDSWAGSRVSNDIDGNRADMGEDAAMASLTRISNLGANGTPDLVIIYGGTNDLASRMPIGAPTANRTTPDLTVTKWSSVAEAYEEALLRIRYFYPKAEILALLPGYVPAYYTRERVDALHRELAPLLERLGVKRADLRLDGITPENAAEYLPDKIHPNEKGMELIEGCALSALLGEQ